MLLRVALALLVILVLMLGTIAWDNWQTLIDRQDLNYRGVHYVIELRDHGDRTVISCFSDAGRVQHHRIDLADDHRVDPVLDIDSRRATVSVRCEASIWRFQIESQALVPAEPARNVPVP